jgi:hypothetical protein
MTKNQLNLEVQKILDAWQKNHIVGPLDQFSLFQIKKDLAELISKVRKGK